MGNQLSGIINEILKRYPNIDTVDFLESELGLPRFKAEALASRIEKQFCQKTRKETEHHVQRLFEKQEEQLMQKESGYCIDCLSPKEFEHFICWMLEELGYELEQEKHPTATGFEVAATVGGEKVAVETIRCPATINVTDSIILVATESMKKHGCKQSLVIATGGFSEQTIKDAEKVNIQLWNRGLLNQKINQARKNADIPVQTRFPQYQGTLLQSLLMLKEGKEFLVEPKSEGKYDVLLPGVKYPLLTFQTQGGRVTRCVFRIKYNEPVSESEGEAVIGSDGGGNRLSPDDTQAYASIIQYLEQFLE